MLRIADLVTAAAVTLDAPASEPQPGSPTAPSMRSVQSSTANAPAPGSIALGHLLHIPGALKVSTRSKSGSISSHASLDLRSVRSRDRDEVESVYSHRDTRSSRRGSVRASYRSGASSVAGNRSRTSFHRRGQSSQFSLAGPVLTQNREMTDEDADAGDGTDAVAQLATGPGPPLTTRKRVGNFFRKVGGVFSRRKVQDQHQPPTSALVSVPESARVPPPLPLAPSEVDVPLPVTREPHVPVKSLLKSLTIRRRTRRQPE
ncbi:hypothetical protein EXIGLDRAFT_734957 [Exidia glandulosa HHB12029]|uniref:Uncharacterized protein n=1 Tax=Exidia glandulosa HHB12029 TaxID=1314781 RepID=A0A165AWU1_EXIGL|nr:hypothetical protein EXIGLDRAFT_734957 [Exidia glandulosa HHB12029]